MIPFVTSFLTGSAIKIIGVIAIIAALAAGWLYITNLQKSVIILEQNNIKLEEGIKQQNEVIQQQKEDSTKIRRAVSEQISSVQELQNSIHDLRSKFEKNNRDLGKLALKKPGLIQNIVNKASAEAIRCMEIVTGAPLTEKEKNAKTNSEFNSECPNIHPNFNSGLRHK